MSISRNLIAYYRERAPSYEDRDVSERALDVTRLEEICARLLARRAVLEIACGTGIWTEVAANVANSVFATDINRSMLREARKRHQEHDNVSFGIVDAYKLTSLQRQFTAGLAAWWISHIHKERVEAFLRGFHKCLLPGAAIVFMDDTHAVHEESAGTDTYGNE